MQSRNNSKSEIQIALGLGFEFDFEFPTFPTLNCRRTIKKSSNTGINPRFLYNIVSFWFRSSNLNLSFGFCTF